MLNFYGRIIAIECFVYAEAAARGWPAGNERERSQDLLHIFFQYGNTKRRLSDVNTL